jgi:hypothetical protein
MCYSFRQEVSHFFMVLGALAIAALWAFKHFHGKWIHLNLASTNIPSSNTTGQQTTRSS